MPAVRLNDRAGASTRSSTRTSTASAWVVVVASGPSCAPLSACAQGAPSAVDERDCNDTIDAHSVRRDAPVGDLAGPRLRTRPSGRDRVAHAAATLSRSPVSRSYTPSTRSPHRATAASNTFPAQPQHDHANRCFERLSRSAQSCPLRPQRNQLSLPAATPVAPPSARRSAEDDGRYRISCIASECGCDVRVEIECHAHSGVAEALRDDLRMHTRLQRQGGVGVS